MFRPVTFLTPAWIGRKTPTVVTLIEDAFTDVDTTALTTHTVAPTNVPGGAWLAGVGTFQIVSNKATVNSNANNDMSWKESSDADVTVTCLVTAYNTGGVVSNPGLLVRVSDATHLWLVDISSNGPSGTMYENAGAGYVSRATGTPTGLASGVEATLKIVVSVTTITAFLNDTQFMTYASASSNQTATKHGIRLGKSGVPPGDSKWDSFTVLST